MVQVKKTKETSSQIEFIVEINLNENTNHKVTVDKNFYKELTNEKITAEKLIERSFDFLLERESNQSILKNFNLKEISKYFPEYEDKIKS